MLMLIMSSAFALQLQSRRTFDTVRVAQRVQSVLAAGAVRRHVGNHDGPRLVPNK